MGQRAPCDRWHAPIRLVRRNGLAVVNLPTSQGRRTVVAGRNCAGGPRHCDNGSLPYVVRRLGLDRRGDTVRALWGQHPDSGLDSSQGTTPRSPRDAEPAAASAGRRTRAPRPRVNRICWADFMRRMHRQVSRGESAIIEWLLNHPGADEPTGPWSCAPAALVVVGGCDCGCRSIDFDRDSSGVRPIRDATAVLPDGRQSGLILWGTDSRIHSLEIYDMDRDSSHELPPVTGLRSWDERDAAHSQAVRHRE